MSAQSQMRAPTPVQAVPEQSGMPPGFESLLADPAVAEQLEALMSYGNSAVAEALLSDDLPDHPTFLEDVRGPVLSHVEALADAGIPFEDVACFGDLSAAGADVPVMQAAVSLGEGAPKALQVAKQVQDEGIGSADVEGVGELENQGVAVDRPESFAAGPAAPAPAPAKPAPVVDPIASREQQIQGTLADAAKATSGGLDRGLGSASKWLAGQTGGSPQRTKKIMKTVVGLGTDLLPIVSNIKDAWSAIAGVDPVSGDKLGKWSRVLHGLMAIPVVGNVGKILAKGARSLGGLAKRVGPRVWGALKSGGSALLKTTKGWGSKLWGGLLKGGKTLFSAAKTVAMAPVNFVKNKIQKKLFHRAMKRAGIEVPGVLDGLKHIAKSMWKGLTGGKA